MLSRENLTILSSERNPQVNPTTQSVLQDFEKLDFKNSNKCFNEIVDSYQKKGKIDLFNSVMLNKRKEIIDILDRNLANLQKTNSEAYSERQEEFRKQYGRHILKVDEVMHYGKELQNRLQVFKDQAEEVLLDFKKLKLNDNYTDSSGSINYNPHGSQNANPFDKIANYYRYEKNIFLFNYVILTKRKEIMEILDSNNVDEATKERFKVRFGRYLLRIEEGMDYAKEFLSKGDSIGFFDGCYWPNTKTGRRVNHYDHLIINIKSEESLETSCLFSKKTEKMEAINYEVEKIMICRNSKRIATIKKNDKQQRNYCFEDAICDMEMRWSAKDEKGESGNCFVILNVDSDQIGIGKLTINGKDIKLDEILELTKQNKEVLIKGQALHEFLEEYLEQDIQSQKEEVVTLEATAPVSSVNFSFDTLEPGELQAGCIGGGYDLKYFSGVLNKLCQTKK